MSYIRYFRLYNDMSISNHILICALTNIREAFNIFPAVAKFEVSPLLRSLHLTFSLVNFQMNILHPYFKKLMFNVICRILFKISYVELNSKN